MKNSGDVFWSISKAARRPLTYARKQQNCFCRQRKNDATLGFFPAHLGQRAGVEVRTLDMQLDVLDQLLRPRHPTQPQPGTEHLRHGIEPQHSPLRVQRQERGHRLLREIDETVGVVLKDQYVVLAADLVDLPPPVGGYRGPRGVRPSGVDVEQLGHLAPSTFLGTLGLPVLEGVDQRLRHQTQVVLFDGDQSGPERFQLETGGWVFSSASPLSGAVASRERLPLF